MIYPFELQLEEMVQLSTGTVANEATSVDMEQAYAIGEVKLMSFLKERVLVDEPDFILAHDKSKTKNVLLNVQKDRVQEFQWS